MLRRITLVIGLLAACLVSTAQAQYPDHPVRFIVPNPPGGGTDVVARQVGERLTTLWGQSVVVENKPGGGGNIGAQSVVRSKPDGYTLFSSHGGVSTVNEFLFKDMGFDPHTDLVPITLVATTPFVIAVNPSVPAKTLPELIALLKSDPTKYFWASTAVGTPDHLGGELLQMVTGSKMTHVPFKGSAEGMKEVVSGRIAINYVSVPTSKPQIESGALRPLAVTSPQRSPLLPNVPTVAEAGAPGAEMLTWFGLWAPADTPMEIRTKIAADVKKVLESPELREKFGKDGFNPQPTTPAEFDTYIKAERAKFGKIASTLGLQKE